MPLRVRRTYSRIAFLLYSIDNSNVCDVSSGVESDSEVMTRGASLEFEKGVGQESVVSQKHEENTANCQELGDDAASQGQTLSSLKLHLVFSALCLCTFLVGLDFTLIATAVPRITSDFHTVNDVGWYGGAFYLTLCASQPLAGKTFTLFSKKIVYLWYLASFEIGSLICATAPNSKVLIVGRAVAGLGASGVFAGGLIIVITIVPLHRRPIYQGLVNATFSVASIVGPVISGALTQHATWRWCFYLNIPAGFASAALVIVIFNVKKAATEKLSIGEKIHRLDGLGFVLFAGSVTMILLALQWGGETYPWNSSVEIGLFVGATATLPLFVWQQFRRQDTALIPPSLFANRNFTLIFASAWFSSGSFQTVVYWLPIWFQGVQGISPTASGVRYLAVVGSDVLMSFIGAGVVQIWGRWNPFLLAGFAFVSTGSGLLTTLSPGISDGHWIGYEILCGIGYSLILTMSHLGVQASLPPELVPVGATTLLFAISGSCAIYLSVGQAVYQSRLTSNLSPFVSQVEIRKIRSAGASHLSSAVTDKILDLVINAYSDAVTKVFFISTAAPIIAFLFVIWARWISLKDKGLPGKSNTESMEAQQQV